MGYHVISSKKPKRNLGDIPEYHIVLELDEADTVKFIETFIPETKKSIVDEFRIYRVKVQVSIEEFSNQRHDQVKRDAWKEKD